MIQFDVEKQTRYIGFVVKLNRKKTIFVQAFHVVFVTIQKVHLVQQQFEGGGFLESFKPILILLVSIEYQRVVGSKFEPT